MTHGVVDRSSDVGGFTVDVIVSLQQEDIYLVMIM